MKNVLPIASKSFTISWWAHRAVRSTECTTDVRQWYLQNGLQLNPDKSEALIVGITNQLHAVTSSVSSVSKCWGLCSIGVWHSINMCRCWRDCVVTKHRPSDTFDTCLLWNWHRPRPVVRLSRIDYCNAVLHGAPSYSIKKLQLVQNNAVWIILEAPRWSHASLLLRTLHWLSVHQRIQYKVALLMFKVRSTLTPSYLCRLMQDRQHSHSLQSATTTFAKHAYWCSAPAGWNSVLKICR